MQTELENLLNKIQESYKTINDKTELNLEVQTGKKYAKIVKKKSLSDSVWGFVVTVEDDPKFKRGDILKAASWKTPAKNFARGNIFDADLTVDWKGAGA